MKNNEIVAKEQNGFRKDHSTTDHIFSLLTICKNKLKDGKQTFRCFVDFRKDFEYVDRVCLFMETGVTSFCCAINH